MSAKSQTQITVGAKIQVPSDTGALQVTWAHCFQTTCGVVGELLRHLFSISPAFASCASQAPNAPRPVAKSGRADGRGVGTIDRLLGTVTSTDMADADTGDLVFTTLGGKFVKSKTSRLAIVRRIDSDLL